MGKFENRNIGMESRNSGEISECLLNCILDIVENCRNCNTRKVIELKIIVFKVGVEKLFYEISRKWY